MSRSGTSSSTMIVIRMAMTPSLKASRRFRGHGGVVPAPPERHAEEAAGSGRVAATEVVGPATLTRPSQYLSGGGEENADV
jgi:hypothetical protein